MVWQTNGDDQWTEQPNPAWIQKESVMFKSDLLPIKFFKFSSQFSPVITDQYLFIFVKLEEDNICLFYNFPFGKTCRYVLASLAIVKFALIRMDKFVAIWCFNEFNDNKNSVLFMFRVFEKGKKENSTSSFS